MSRLTNRSFIGTGLACAGALLTSAGADAAVTAAGVPALTSAAFASPVTLHWTPGTTDQDDHGDHGHGHHHRGMVQLVVRAPGACPMSFRTARVVGYYEDGAEHDFSDAVADGTYCYSVVTADGESLAAGPSLTVTVNAAAVQPVAAPAPAPVVPAVAPTAPSADVVPPTAPTGVKVIISRARSGSARVPVTVRWSLPADADLDHVEVVLNAQHVPTTRIDGAIAYRGRGTSAQVTVAPGRKTFIALFAVDAAGNASTPTVQALRLPMASSLRPLDGSRLTAAPVLSWKPVTGASYYNVQLFRNGKRVLVAWPGQPSYRLPAAKLSAGTYVWFVWPALAPKHASPKFAARIGRGTFTYVG